jgi:FtsH-binding integral membrane protein
MAPAGGSAFTLGRGLVAGASLVGLGTLCFYGVGLGSEAGAIDRAAIWPQVVKDRMKATYMYFGGSLIFTAASAVAVARSPTMLNLVSRGGWMSLIATIAAMWGTGMLCMALPYQEGLGAKQLAWMLHSSVIGAVIAPLTLLGGPLMIRAACYTGGIVGGLSALAMCAPSEKFLNMGGPLAMGFGAVFVASIGSAFLPPTTVLGSGLYSVAIYGGLVLFGMFLLYDTQKVIHRAENQPVYAAQPFDPVNNSVGIYLDTINIFVRMVMILAMGGGNKRK